MSKGKHKQPLYDEHGHRIGSVENAHSSHHPSNFSRFILSVVIAAALGYAANTPMGHQLIDKALKSLTRESSHADGT